MKRLVSLVLSGLLLVAAACGDDDGPSRTADAGPTADAAPDAGYVPTACVDTDQAFVRHASLAILGRRPLSQAEVEVWADVLGGARDALGDDEKARRVTVRAMSADPAHVERWTQHFMDRLRVPRIDDQSLRTCYGATRRELDDGSLARHVLMNGPSAGGDGKGSFTMLDLLRSSLVADDISPVYRGHLFALVSRPIPAANVPPVQAELARRADYGTVFDAAYLNRDIVCLGCHNSEFSVTFREDPAENRHWSMPGLFEKALYGASSGIDPNRAHAVFRYDGFVTEGGGERPWGWAASCGEFVRNVAPDLADVDAYFGPIRGKTTTVYDLEAMLARGFAKIAADGVQMDAEGVIADPDEAFAWLVAASIVEGVWIEMIGTPLTIANYFSRNQAQRDLLQQLTERFVASRFSVRTLVEDIAVSDWFNRQPPAQGCGPGPYAMDNVYDPWVIGDEDPARRRNGSGDAVAPLSARTILSAAYAALEWQAPKVRSFPEVGYCDQASCGELNFVCSSFGVCCGEKTLYCEMGAPRPDAAAAFDEYLLQRGIGVFLRNSERGFRGLDFQARLEWEYRYGRCENPGAGDDFVDRLVGRATSAGATLRDVVVALKDRLIGEPRVDDAGGERAALEALFGATLDTPASAVSGLETRVRRLCGVLLSSPQFLLAGAAPRDGDTIPALTPIEASYDAVCAALASRGLGADLTLTCSPGGLVVSR